MKQITIAIGASRKTKVWQNTELPWSKLVERLSKSTQTAETMAEYMAMSKEQQTEIKDVGGFVGGLLKDGLRNNASMLRRSLITLDYDAMTPQHLFEIQLELDGNAYVVHSTHKYKPGGMRVRVVVPLSEEVSPEQYQLLARHLAGRLGMEGIDQSTFEAARMMFWPSHPRDIDPLCLIGQGDPFGVREALSIIEMRSDVHTTPNAPQHHLHASEKAADPRCKDGVIGAFCRTYSIEQTIARFLPEVYTPAGRGRYTYAAGSTSGGAVVFDGILLYSFHGTDPAAGRSQNAFDLVRIHKFGHLDRGCSESGTRLPSFRAMEEFALQQPGVGLSLNRERIEACGSDPTSDDDPLTQFKATLKWNKKGGLDCTLPNAKNVLMHDPNLKGKIKLDTFAHQIMVEDAPWRRDYSDGRPHWSNNDDANLRDYLAREYRLEGTNIIADALACASGRNCFHPVRDYLQSLRWDGVPRIDRAIVDYLGAQDTLLTREATRLFFLGAVARVMEPGCKFDLCLTLTGPENCGKSSFFRVLGGEWFSNTIPSLNGKDGMEALMNVWIAELAELAAVKRSEAEGVKSFITTQEDRFRPAYARQKEVYPRQCVFGATTNETEFLRGFEGNRRFVVIQILPQMRTQGAPVDALERDRDQLWAEAFASYEKGRPLILSDEAVKEALLREELHNYDKQDDRFALVEEFLDTPIPQSWDTMTPDQKRGYILTPHSEGPTMTRERVSVAEIMWECFGIVLKERAYKTLSSVIRRYLRTSTKWESLGLSARIKGYGKQRIYTRKSPDLCVKLGDL